MCYENLYGAAVDVNELLYRQSSNQHVGQIIDMSVTVNFYICV